MRFTKEQYENAIANLTDAMNQLEPDGNKCRICHDSGHQAWECGSNPLYAVACCRSVAERSRELHDQIHVVEDAANDTNVDAERAALLDDLHEFLHFTSGACSWMGESVGPGKVRPL